MFKGIGALPQRAKSHRVYTDALLANLRKAKKLEWLVTESKIIIGNNVHIGDYEPRYNGVFEVAPNEFIDLIPPNVIVEAYDYQYIKKPVEHTEKP